MAKYEDLVSEEDWLLAMDGHAWTFGDHVSRRQLLPDQYLSVPPEKAAPYVLNEIAPRLSLDIVSGDFLVAGLDFGSDANEKSIPAALLHLGVAAVIARSFGHFFFKNSVNLGLPALVIEESAAIQQGDRLRVDVEAHIIANKSWGDRYVIRNLNDDEINILRAGNLVSYARQQRSPKAER